MGGVLKKGHGLHAGQLQDRQAPLEALPGERAVDVAAEVEEGLVHCGAPGTNGL